MLATEAVGAGLMALALCLGILAIASVLIWPPGNPRTRCRCRHDVSSHTFGGGCTHCACTATPWLVRRGRDNPWG